MDDRLLIYSGCICESKELLEYERGLDDSVLPKSLMIG